MDWEEAVIHKHSNLHLKETQPWRLRLSVFYLHDSLNKEATGFPMKLMLDANYHHSLDFKPITPLACRHEMNRLTQI